MNSHTTILEISKSALLYNLNYFKNKLNKTTKMLVLVKAFAYGLGAVKIAELLQNNKVDYLAVAYLKEGIALRQAGITLPIILLHPCIADFEQLIKFKIEPSLYNQRILKKFIKHCTKHKLTNYPIHLKFNTGLNRLGFSIYETDYILSLLSHTNTIKVASIFSHLAESEKVDDKDFTLKQISIFKEIASNIEKSLSYKPLKHILNTSGIVNYPEAQFDMARLGIGIYGFGSDKNITDELKNVVTLKTTISQINKIKKGITVGYGRTYKAIEKTTVATIPIGYADGISRKLGNKIGCVKVNNKKAPIIGNICMDMLMVDVTDINCKEEDEVIIFDDQNMVLEICSKTQTISNEILATLSQRIYRKLVD